MKHIINVLVTLLLVGMAVGATIILREEKNEYYAWLYLPIVVFMFFWGDKLMKDY